MSNDFEEKVLNKLDELDRKVSCIDEIKEKVSKIDAIEEKISCIDEIKEKVSRIDAIEEKISCINEIKEKVSRIDAMEEKISCMDEIKEKVSKIDEIEKIALTNGRKIDHLDYRVGRMEGSLILMESKLNNDLKAIHEGHILNTELRVEDRKKIDSLERQDFDYAARISNLELAVEKNSEQIKKLIS